MNRRQLLLTSSSGLAAALAGCSALSGGDGGTETATPTPTPTGPPAFEEVSLSAPESVTVGSEFTLTVSATNTGGETGTYEGTVRLAGSEEEDSSPSFEESVTIEEIAPTDTGEATVTVPAFEVVDDYEFTLADADASVAVRPEPVTAAVGETLSVGDDLSVTVDDVSVRESVFTLTTRSSGLSTVDEIASFGAPSGDVLAIVTVTAENTGTEATSAASGTIGIGDGEWYGSGGGAPGAILGRSDDRFTNGGLPEIDPSESVTGYFVAQIPRETARGTIEVTGQLDGQGTLPERVWTVEPDGDERALPQLTLESVEAPETAPLGRDYEITVTVANEGDAPGTLRSVVQWDDDGSWAQLRAATSRADLSADRPTGGVIRREVDAGGTAEITLTSFSVYNQQYSYRIQPFAEEWQIGFEGAELSYGDRLKAGSNANIVVQDIRLQDTVTAYDDFQDEEYEAEPDDGNQFVAVQFRFTRRVESESGSTPDTSDFTLLADGNDVGSSTYVDDQIREDWYDPIENELEDRSEAAGWDFYEVPAEYSASDLAVHYEYSPGFGSSVGTVATWE
jgi:hypothetical protein